MLSEADTRTIGTCRQVLRDLATASKNEAYYGGTNPANDATAGLPMMTGEVYARGQFAGYCAAADHALAGVLTHAATYLDDVHAQASAREWTGQEWREYQPPGPRPLEP